MEIIAIQVINNPVIFVRGVAVAQEVEHVSYESEGWWFDPRLLRPACQSILWHDAEPRAAPDGCWIESVSEQRVNEALRVLKRHI